MDTTERLHVHFSLSCMGGGNGNPLQCSCLENPRDCGAWWAAVSGVTQSRTRLKRLSSSSGVVSEVPNAIVHNLMNQKTNTISQRVSKMVHWPKNNSLYKFKSKETWSGLFKFLCCGEDNTECVSLSGGRLNSQLSWALSFNIPQWVI